jgi:hypothetical protein
MIPREYGMVGRKNKIRTFGRRGRKYIIRATPAFFGICAIERERERGELTRSIYIHRSSYHRDSWRSEMAKVENLFLVAFFCLLGRKTKEKRIPGKGERTTK